MSPPSRSLRRPAVAGCSQRQPPFNTAETLIAHQTSAIAEADHFHQLHDPSQQHHDITTKLADDESDESNEDEGEDDEALYGSKDSTCSTATTTPRPSFEASGVGHPRALGGVFEGFFVFVPSLSSPSLAPNRRSTIVFTIVHRLPTCQRLLPARPQSSSLPRRTPSESRSSRRPYPHSSH